MFAAHVEQVVPLTHTELNRFDRGSATIVTDKGRRFRHRAPPSVVTAHMLRAPERARALDKIPVSSEMDRASA